MTDATAASPWRHLPNALTVLRMALVVPLAFNYEMDGLARKVKGYKPNLLGKPKYEFISLAE